MSYHWTIVEEAPLLPFENMESDYQKLLHLDQNSAPILRFYQWQERSATYGYFLDPADYLLPGHLSIARRPTGGGIIFHDYDLSFSLLVPASHPCYSTNTLQNYAFVNYCLRAAFKKFHPLLPIHLFSCKGECRPRFCMAGATIYDLIVDGKKMVGGAMRKTSKGFLHQGSICLRLPDRQFFTAALKNPALAEEMEKQSYPLLQGHAASEYEEQRAYLKHCIAESFTSVQTNPFILC